LQELNNSRSLLQKFLAVLVNADAKEERRIESWRKGALGELEIGRLLDRIAAENEFVVLHDRAIPRSQANIDHILITPTEIFVIDAKNHTGLVKIDEGSLLDPNATPTLYVGNRKQMSLVHGCKKQASLIEAALVKAKVKAPVSGILAFYKADFPMFFKPIDIDGVLINGKGIETTVFERQGKEVLDVAQVTEIRLKAFPEK